MKFLLSILIIMGTVSLFGQKTISLIKVDKNTVSADTTAIIYGKFIQRLDRFNRGDFPQEIRIINAKTNQIYTLRVKPTFQSKKENIMCFKIPRGEYLIHSYQWTKGEWYNGTTYDDPVFKVSNSKIKNKKLERFKFNIEENKIYYLGTWNFSKPLAQFLDDKKKFDKVVKKKYKNLDIEEAIIVIPN